MIANSINSFKVAEYLGVPHLFVLSWLQGLPARLRELVTADDTGAFFWVHPDLLVCGSGEISGVLH